MDNVRIRILLAESLTVWGVSGRVEPGGAASVAVVRAEDGTIVWIERAPDDVPFRWAVRWRTAVDAAGGSRERRPRLCGSLTGVLKSVREALGVNRGSALVRAAAPDYVQ